MSLTLAPLDASFGAVVTQVALADLSEIEWQTIETAFEDYGFLAFPAQHLSEDEQTSFAQRFGSIEYLIPSADIKTVAITNINPDGSLIDQEADMSKIMDGNEGWHSDSSYLPVSAKASVLSAHVIPTRGGETEFADMQAAYDALPQKTRDRISDLAAFHSLYYSQAKIGHDAKKGAMQGGLSGLNDPVVPLRPLVKTHPVTGRKCLYIGRHAYGVTGLSEEESQRLLEELVTFACQVPRTFTYPWSVGDVVIWDNRRMLHRARPFDRSQPRLMKHTRIAGDPITESGIE